jgi:cephalosporin hydroxylase
MGSFKTAVRKLLAPSINSLFLRNLVRKTNNFRTVHWLGHPVWQNVLDLWTIQETIHEVRPELLIECGTNQGGSSMFYAHLFDLMSHGRIVTIDVEKMHDRSHPRITYLIGSSTAPEIVDRVAAMVDETRGPVMVILDSDHSESHVRKELDCYARFVTPNSYCLVQDGVIDVHSAFAVDRPGPLPAIEAFLKTTNEFEVDEERCERFLITHHPKGWLRRKAGARGEKR